MRQFNPSLYAGGTGAIEYLMRRYCGRQLTQGQASALWERCAQVLRTQRQADTIAAAEGAATGCLGLPEQVEVLDALGLVFVGRHWPVTDQCGVGHSSFWLELKRMLDAQSYAVVEV